MSIADLFRLDGHVALITGGGGAIGRSMAKAFAEMGADVALTSRRANKLEAAAKDVEALGRRALILPADIVDRDTPAQLVARTVEFFGKLTILVNNAGGVADKDAKPGRTLDIADDAWTQLIDLNLSSIVRLTKAAVPAMSDGGSIVNISSIVSLKPNDKSGGYGTAKAALNHVTLSLSQDLAPRIRVNAIVPGPIATFGFRKTNGVTEADYPRIAKEWGVLLDRIGLEDDISAAAVFLCSRAGGWITGQNLVVSGGM